MGQAIFQRFQCFMRFSCSEIVQRKNENTWLLVWPHPLKTPESAVSADVVFAADSTGHVIRVTTGEPLEVII